MARQEQDREDILREATALVERAEIAAGGFAETVVIGFRQSGAASVFFGADPVYQFNTANELRRAYRDGRLIKAESGKLIELERRRAEGQVQMIRWELDDEQSAEFLSTARRMLLQLRQSLDSNEFDLIGQVPAEADVIARTVEWLASLPAEITIATKANVT